MLWALRPASQRAPLLFTMALLLGGGGGAFSQHQLDDGGRPPVIIIPGLGGSVLEARLHGKEPYRDCPTEADWFTIWQDPHYCVV